MTREYFPVPSDSVLAVAAATDDGVVDVEFNFESITVHVVVLPIVVLAVVVVTVEEEEEVEVTSTNRCFGLCGHATPIVLPGGTISSPRGFFR
jgi:hypothetical protein